ncbi:hypothetical protein pb186bvf_004186 [Paramecium bursaria]
MKKKDYQDEYEYDNVCFCIPFKKRKADLRKSNLTNGSHVLSLQDEKEKRSFYESPGLTNLGTPDISQSKKKLQSSGSVFDLPKNKLFLMDGKKYGNNSQILIKITEREINTNLLTQSWQPTENQDKTTPVYVARYIAKRLKQNHQVVVDLGCGMGGNTVQFAKECSYVIGVDIDLELLKITEESCQQNRVNYKVDLVNANLFDLKNLKADVIFTNPTCKTRGRNKNIDMDLDCQPNFAQLIQKCKLMAPNTIIQMPANIDMNQLTQYFNFNKMNAIMQKQYVHSVIEVEQLIVNNVHEWNIIYVGDVANVLLQLIAQVTNDEIYHTLAKLLNQYQKQPNQKINLRNLFKTLQRYISTYNLIIQVLESIQDQHTIEKFLYELQLRYVKEMDLVSAYNRIQSSKNQQDFEYVQSIVQSSFNNMHHDRDDIPHSPALYSIKEDNMVPQFSYTNSFDQFEQNNNDFQLQFKTEKYS